MKHKWLQRCGRSYPNFVAHSGLYPQKYHPMPDIEKPVPFLEGLTGIVAKWIPKNEFQPLSDKKYTIIALGSLPRELCNLRSCRDFHATWRN